MSICFSRVYRSSGAGSSFYPPGGSNKRIFYDGEGFSLKELTHGFAPGNQVNVPYYGRIFVYKYKEVEQALKAEEGESRVLVKMDEETVKRLCKIITAHTDFKATYIANSTGIYDKIVLERA